MLMCQFGNCPPYAPMPLKTCYNYGVIKLIMYQTALRINKKSFSNGENYHIGMKGLDVTLTHLEGWTIKTEIIMNDKGNLGLHVWHERI